MSQSVFGERVSVLGVIKSILDSYPFSVGIFRELLQNSDDAKAQEQVFVLDCRSHSSEKLRDPAFVSLQGPALLAFNGAKFLKEDWVALQNISESSKKEDTSKIGKFGIGIRSCYHVTDQLQILSDDTLVTFDPQKILVSDGVLQLSLNDDVEDTIDHFQPFKHFLGDDWAGGTFEGTVVRLPLRRFPGELRDKVVTAQEIEQLMQDFISDEFNIGMLFLQNLRSIKLFKIDEQGTIKELGSSLVKVHQVADGIFRKLVTVTGRGIDIDERWLIVDALFPDEDAIGQLSLRTSGLGNTVLRRHKLRPHVGIAFPLDHPNYNLGQLFTYLRLPLKTGFPAHVHAFFALTPSRQNLRNQGDNGLVKGSDDHLLVEWNKLLFEVFIPKAWSRFLQILVEIEPTTGVFDAWPPLQHTSTCGESVYWNSFSTNVLSFVMSRELPVWPIYGKPDAEYKSMGNLFTAGPDVPQNVLDVLAGLGFSITRPPAYIVKMLKGYPSSQRAFLNPESVSNELRAKYIPILCQAGGTTSVTFPTLLDYLLSTQNLSNIIGLPIIPTVVVGTFVALSMSEGSSTVHTLMEEADVNLFNGSDDQAIPLHCLSPFISTLLQNQGPSILNVKKLDDDLVVRYLSLKGLDLPESLPGLSPGVITFLSEFWVWFDRWGLRDLLWPKLQSLYLLPASHQLKEVTTSIFHGTACTSKLATKMEELGVPFLNPQFAISSAREVLRRWDLLKEADNIHALLDCLSPNRNDTGPVFAEADAKLLLKHISDHHSRSTAIRGRLTTAQHTTLKSLHIFPTVSTTPDTARKVISWTSLNRFTSIYGVSSTEILPDMPNTAFLPNGSIDARMLDLLRATSSTALSDIDVLDLAIQLKVLPSQSSSVIEGILTYLSSRSRWLSDRARGSLKQEKLVHALNGTLTAPKDLLDPSNPLYPLYSSESSRIPSTSTASQVRIVRAASALRLFDSTLSAVNVTDRIRWVSTNASDPSFFGHSLALLKIIDSQGFNCTQLPSISSEAWLPTQDKCLVSSSMCRPMPTNNDEIFLFDQVLKPLHPDAAISSSLMRVFGWDQRIPVAILVEQLRLTLLSQNPTQCQRVIIILIELGKRSLTNVDTQRIRTVVQGAKWVPTSRYELVEPSCAVFRHFVPEAGIYEIAPALKTVRNVCALLQRLGCTDKPTFDTVVAVLHRFLEEKPSVDNATAAVSLLKFAAFESFSDSQLGQLLVPDDSHYLHPITDVVFNDIGERAILVPRVNFYLASPLVDNSLARSLKLGRLGLKFVDLQDPFEDMGASPVTLVQKTLQSYTERQFPSEFLANAEDAGATKFKIVVNELSTQGQQLLSPELEKFYNCPSVLIYNDSIFSEKDFRGMCRLHVGGKKDDPHSIGQFGQGALTMFHFTELAMIVSGSHVLFLDPSKTHLPLPRAALKLPLKDLLQWYPDHLTSLKESGLFDIQDGHHFPGTIFMLPLRNATHCQGGNTISKILWEPGIFKAILHEFRAIAPQTLLFLHLGHIEVQTRSPGHSFGPPQKQWSVTSQRQQSSREGFQFITTRITEDSLGRYPSDSRWLVVSSKMSPTEVPAEHRQKNTKYIRTGLAACLDDSVPPCKFFSTLPLAIRTTLPVHVNASFLLSSDRRQIRHDSYGNAETTFNQWLLSDPLPKAYLALLEEIAREGENERWWPGNRARQSGVDDDDDDDALTANQDDALTSTLMQSFYSTHVASTKRRVLSPMFIKPDDQAYQPLRPDQAVLYSHRLPTVVKGLLRHHLRPDNIARLRIPSKEKGMSGILDITPEDVKALICNRNACPMIRSQIPPTDLQDLLRYLCTSHASNLIGLPLMRLRNNEWVKFNQQHSGSPRYIWDNTHSPIQGLFPLTSFVYPFAYDSDVTSMLIKGGLNIAIMDANAVKALAELQIGLLQGPERTRWVTHFWRSYPYFPQEDLRVTIESLPLVPSVSGDYVSLVQCKDDRVLLSTSLDDADTLSSVQDFNITIIARDQCPPALIAILRMKDYSKPDIFLVRFLRTTKSSIATAKAKLDGWPDERRKAFATWLRSQLRTKLPEDVLPTARQLPIWHARRLLSKEWKPATDIKLLPVGLDQAAARFLTVFVTSKAEAASLNVPRLSLEDVENNLQIPRHLLPADELIYRDILVALLGARPTKKRARKRVYVQVPNTNRMIVPSNQLYTRDTLTKAAFGPHSKVFLLPSFAGLESWLRAQNLIKHPGQLDMNMFSECAQALHDDNDDSDKTSRARVLFRTYCEDLPLKISSNQNSQWSLVDNLQFIPRDTSTTKLSLAIPNDIRSLPSVVTPADLVRKEFEDIAWTQKARFETQPDQRVLVANPKLGQPSASIVVDHLQAICRMRKGDDVLKYLKETYKWLNNNATEARATIEQCSELDIFLNVDDATSDQWAFVAASQMAFENHDVRTIQRVRNFLTPFKALLKVAGVIDVVYPDVDTQPAPENSDQGLLERMRNGFADMRNDRVFTDVVFTSEDDSDMDSENRPRFFAHRNFLSVFSGYFKDMFTGSYAESQAASSENPMEICLDHSRFAIKTVLDYLYTGDVISQDQEDIPFEDLLQVMELSHYLDIKSLFENVQLEVIRRKLVDPLTLDDVRSRAATVEANQLRFYCDKYRNSNIEYIRRIQSNIQAEGE